MVSNVTRSSKTGTGFGGPPQWSMLSGGEVVAKDPVCGMDVDEQKAAATSEYQGQTYYFCAPGCKKAFDQNPEQYIGQQSSQKS